MHDDTMDALKLLLALRSTSMNKQKEEMIFEPLEEEKQNINFWFTDENFAQTYRKNAITLSTTMLESASSGRFLQRIVSVDDVEFENDLWFVAPDPAEELVRQADGYVSEDGYFDGNLF